MEENSEITNKIDKIIQDMGETANKKTYKSKEKELMKKIKDLNNIIEINKINHSDRELVDVNTAEKFKSTLNEYLNQMITNREGRGSFFFPSGLKTASKDLEGKSSIVEKFAILEGKKLKSSSSLSEEKVKEFAKLYGFITGGKQIANWQQAEQLEQEEKAEVEKQEPARETNMMEHEEQNTMEKSAEYLAAEKIINKNNIKKDQHIAKKGFNDYSGILQYLDILMERARKKNNKYGLDKNYYLHICEKNNLIILIKEIDKWMGGSEYDQYSRNLVWNVLTKSLNKKCATMDEPIKTTIENVNSMYNKLNEAKVVASVSVNGDEYLLEGLYSSLQEAWEYIIKFKDNQDCEKILWEDKDLKKAILACTKN